MQVVLGLAGWAYPEWVGPFYPRGAKPGDFLKAYARAFRFAEVDSTYYAAPSREDAARWAASTPEGFVFSPKLPRAIVGAPELARTKDAVADFLVRLAPLRAAGKLGPVLAAFPPSFRRETQAGALARFVEAWPRDAPLALELRHASWWTEETFELLRAHGVIHVWAVTEYGRTPPVRTASELYVRLIGDRALDLQTTRWDRPRREQSEEMEYWRAQIQRMSDEVEKVWIIANNHFMGYAPETARRVAELLRTQAPDLAAASREPGQRGLFG